MGDLSQHPETAVAHAGYRSDPATYVRAPVGIEHIDDITGDPEQAAEAAKGVMGG